MIDIEPPFRWDLTCRSRLGNLIEGEKAPTYHAFLDDLLPCCARVIAFAGDADLVFVGRSPESIFDHLSGLLLETSWFDRLQLLHFSMRYHEEPEIDREHPDAIEAMRSYLRRLGLAPESIATGRRPVAFIDLVASGDTFGRLVRFLFNWSRDIHYDWSAVRRRIRLVGITWRKKTSPNTWRWQQHAEWLTLLENSSVKNVSIPWSLWDYLGNWQQKVSRSYVPSLWGDPALARPGRDEEQLKALRLAYALFEHGRMRERREELVALLVREPAVRHHWLRELIGEIR